MVKIDPRYMPTYDPASVQYMRDELNDVGFRELHSLDEIDEALNSQNDQSVFLIINSVCGCAAGGARPGVALALQHHTIPDQLVSVFAGQDKQEVEYVRQRYLSDYVPSSPCLVLFRNGEIEFIMERKDIVNKDPEEISDILTKVFDRRCSRTGPSIPREEYNKLSNVVMCSSNIPRFDENENIGTDRSLN